MKHVDDWLDAPPKDEAERLAKEWLEHWRRPAVGRNGAWSDAHVLSCEYKGKRYRVIGASRLGDVWLTSNFGKTYGYELRIGIDDCTNWQRTGPTDPPPDMIVVERRFFDGPLRSGTCPQPAASEGDDMSTDSIERMAREYADNKSDAYYENSSPLSLVLDAYKAGALSERERCAKVCERAATLYGSRHPIPQSTARDCAAALRANPSFWDDAIRKGDKP